MGVVIAFAGGRGEQVNSQGKWRNRSDLSWYLKSSEEFKCQGNVLGRGSDMWNKGIN